MKIKEIKKIESFSKRYDIQTEKHHNFFANNILVHNSLGILYWLNDKPWITTRGSFTSDQALWATDWFRKNINCDNLPKDLTLLFEIIFDMNRIVVKYDFEGLVFLAAI